MERAAQGPPDKGYQSDPRECSTHLGDSDESDQYHRWAAIRDSLDVRLTIWSAQNSERPELTLTLPHRETGNDKAGLQHILAEHSKEFENYEPQQLMELAQASTSIGLPMGIQGKKGRSRPIFGLFFYDKPLAVAVQVGSNGFVVSMNKKSLDAVVAANSHLGSLDEVKQLLEQSHSWPKV